MEQLVNFIIRPPRADYNPKDDLLDKEFMLKGQWFQRKDLEVTNSRGDVLQCSHYMPVVIPEGVVLPCVIYCHGNSGCRADASEAAIILLPSYITVFSLDFSGSGLSGGEHVTLGWNEKDDLKAVVNYLRSDGNVSCIGLWGRSMGAVTSLMYGAEDPSIAGMVLDSPFSDLVDLMNELVDTYKFRLPKFTVKFAIQYMRKVIQKKAKFDIMDLNTIKVAKSCFVPVLIGHAIDDDFIQPHHSERIYDAYEGDKNIIKFEGDHNSPRPQFYFDSITIFFHNVLHPPKDAVEGNYFDTMHGYFGKGSWDTVHDVGYTNHNFTGASEGMVTSSTEDAINELRSKRPMSRMEVPSDVPSNEKQSGDQEGHEYDPVSSSGLISFEFANGHAHVPLVSTTIDDDQYVEYPLDNLSDFPCNMEEEERMFMEAVMESLKDLEPRHPREEEQLSNMGFNSPESSQKDDPESSSKAEHCGSSKMDGSCTSVTNNKRDVVCEHPSPDGSSSSAGPSSETPPSFIKPGGIDEHPSPDVSVSSVGTAETPPSFIKSGSIGEHSSPDVSVSSAVPTSGTPPSFNAGSIGTSARSDVSVSDQNSSDGDRSIKEADMAGGTRATVTVQRNPTSHVLDGLMHRWGLNFFRNS